MRLQDPKICDTGFAEQARTSPFKNETERGVFILSRVRKINVPLTVDWSDALAEFLKYKTAQGISDHTYDDYDKHVHLFFKRFPHAWESDTALTDSLFAHLSEDIKPATYNNRLIYLRTFLNWCVENGIILRNPLANIKKRKDEGRVVNIDLRVIQELLKQPDQKTYVGLRDYTLMLMMLDNGIRPKEALSLVPFDFNAAGYEVIVPSTVAKTRKSRTLPLSDLTVRYVKKLIAARSPDWSDNVPIFCTYEGRPMNRHTWGDRLEIYCKRIGTHIRPYDLRHVFSIEFLRNGANAFTLQRALGHTDISMTKRYVALVESDIKAEHEKATPLKKILPEVRRMKKL